MEQPQATTASARIPSALKRNPNADFTYNREFILNLLSLELPLPVDADDSLGCFIDAEEESRLPLAHLPLSDMEKKLLSMVSINSDAQTTRRAPYGKGTNRYDANGPNRHQQTEEHRKKQQAKADRKPKEIKSDDLWDIPTDAPSGFGADGVFGVASSIISPKDQDMAPVIQRNAWSVLDNDDAGSNRSSPPQKTNDLFSDSLGNNSSVSSRLPFTAFGGDHAPMQPSRLGHSSLRGMPPLSASSLPSGPVGPPGPFKFVPPQWLYQDPSQRLQGPFTSEQMHGWYKEGYFPPQLPIKCVGDNVFIPLHQLIERYGNDAPFLISLTEQEALEREVYMEQVNLYMQQQQQQQQQAQQPSFGAFAFGTAPIAPSSFPLGISGATPSVLSGAESFFSTQPASAPPATANTFAPVSGATNVTSPDQEAFIKFMNQKQKMSDSTPSSEPEPTKRAKSPAKQPSLVKAATQSPVKEVDSVVEMTKKLDVNEPKAKPVVPSAKKGKKNELAETVADVEQETKAAVAEPVVAAPPVVVKKTTPAPWAKPAAAEPSKAASPVKSPSSDAPKQSLSEIQRAEQEKQKARNAAKQHQAEQKVLEEARHLAALESSAAASQHPALSSVSQWGNTATGAAAGKSKKTLAEIMADEAKQKQNAASLPSANVSKGYAASVSTSSPSTSTGVKSFAKASASKAAAVVASGPVLKPTSASSASANDGWSVVGGSGKEKTPSSSPSSSAAPSKGPTKLNYSGSPVPASSTATNASGQAPKAAKKPVVSESFQSWYRKTLFAVSKETSLNVEEFVSILLSVPIKETSTITMICDDALSSAIDSRKFATEFINRRLADLNGVAYSAPVDGDGGWTSVKKQVPASSSSSGGAPVADDGFEVVGKKKKGKK